MGTGAINDPERLRPLPPARLRGRGRRMELVTYQWVRRYAVPGWMIEAATGSPTTCATSRRTCCAGT